MFFFASPGDQALRLTCLVAQNCIPQRAHPFAPELAHTLPITNRRYGRLQIFAALPPKTA
jgi:hypothetical protein